MYNTKAKIILEDLKQVLNNSKAKVVSRIQINWGNLRVTWNAGGVPKYCGEKIFGEFRDLANDWLYHSKQPKV